MNIMQYKFRHPSSVASRHLLPRSGRRLLVSTNIDYSDFVYQSVFNIFIIIPINDI